MTKILLIGDPHFKGSKTDNNLEMMERACQEILELIDPSIGLAVILGDTLHTHERIYLRAQAQAIEWIKSIAKRCPTIVLIGNHDRESQNDFMSPVHSLVGLEGTPNVTVINRAIWDKERNFIYVPYVPNGRFKEALATVGYTANPTSEEQPKVIFAHQEFGGCVMGTQISTKGDSWSSQLPKIFSGHIHEYQVMNNITYVGTFHQENYGEGPDKAVMLLTIQEDGFITERIKLKSVPLRTTVHMDISELTDFASKIPPNTLVRVILHLDATERSGLELNPYYQAMERMVDKVVTKIDNDKSSIAQTMVKQMKEEGRLDRLEKSIYTIEEIVTAMLQDDPLTLSLFKEEIM